MDADVLNRLRQGDRAALADAVARLNQWAQRKGLRPDDAKDVVLETVEKAFLAADTYRGEGSVAAWLIGIAQNTWKQRLRQRARHPSRTVSLGDISSAPDPVDHEQLLIDMMAAEEALGRLSDEEREAFLLRERDGLSSEEIAQRMGKTVDAVRCLKYRAARKLGEYKKELEDGT